MSDPRTEDTGQNVRRAADRIGQEASEAARAARDEGRRALDDAKNRAADRADEMARAAEAAADELDKSGDATISGYGHSLASMMRQFAGGLRERDIEDFAAELAQFARRHPAAFLAGSVAVGFGLARAFKAQNGGSIMQRSSSAESDFYGDYDEDYGDEHEAYDPSYEAGEYDSGQYGSASMTSSGDGMGTVSSPTAAPASSGTAPSLDREMAAGADDRYAREAEIERAAAQSASPDESEDRPIETPDPEVQSGPRKGDLP